MRTSGYLLRGAGNWLQQAEAVIELLIQFPRGSSENRPLSPIPRLAVPLTRIIASGLADGDVTLVQHDPY